MRSISAARVDAQVAGAVGGARLLAEVDAAGELAHDEQVGALDDLARAAGWRRSSASTARTGRRLAYRPRPLRRPSRPCSGRGASGSVVSHFGPPTAASSTASAARQAARISSVSAVPWASIDAPPNRCSSNAKSPRRDEELERRGGDLGADPVAGKHGDAHGHGPGSLWFCPADDGRDQRGAQAPRAARGRAGGAARGRAPRRRERAAALRPPGRARAAGDGGRRVQRGDGDRAGAGRGDRARLRPHALARRARLSRRPGHRRPAPERRLVPRGRGALRGLPRGQRGAGARPVAAEPRHGHRRVGVGDRHRRGRPSASHRARGRAARPGCARASPSRSSSARARPACSSSSPAVRRRRIRRCCT